APRPAAPAPVEIAAAALVAGGDIRVLGRAGVARAGEEDIAPRVAAVGGLVDLAVAIGIGAGEVSGVDVASRHLHEVHLLTGRDRAPLVGPRGANVQAIKLAERQGSRALSGGGIRRAGDREQ